MKALDTNVLARFFIDDPDDVQSGAQRPAAIQALSERAFVPLTVLLEFEWVMRGFYGLSRAEVCRVMTALASIEHIVLDDRAALLTAIEAHAKGLDFADALHLARSSRADAFCTFDRTMAKRAKQLGAKPDVELLETAR